MVRQHLPKHCRNRVSIVRCGPSPVWGDSTFRMGLPITAVLCVPKWGTMGICIFMGLLLLVTEGVGGPRYRYSANPQVLSSNSACNLARLLGARYGRMP